MKPVEFCACLLVLSFSLASAKTYVWTQVFTNNVAPSACDCYKWNNFWESVIGDISLVQQIIWTADVSTAAYTCSGNAAKLVAYAMAITPHGYDQIVCDNGTWFTGPPTGGFPDTGNAIQLNSCTSCCSTTAALRPCWPNSGYGGFVPGAACSLNVPTQTVTITVVSSDVVPTPVTSTTVTFSDTYVNGPISATQCSAWQTFWKTEVPLGQQLVISLTGSAAPGFTTTCSGISASMVAVSQYAMTSSSSVMCDGGISWGLNSPGTDYRNAIGVNEAVNYCDSGKVIRPCWGDSNWGGFGGVNCNAPTQTFIVNVTIGNPMVVQNTTACSVAFLDNSTWGNISTVGCTDISLQCNSGFIAAGSSSLVGRYNCSNGVWFPAKPNCTDARTTSTPTSTTTTLAITSTSTTTKTTTTSNTTTSTTTSTSTTTATSTLQSTSTTSATGVQNAYTTTSTVADTTTISQATSPITSTTTPSSTIFTSTAVTASATATHSKAHNKQFAESLIVAVVVTVVLLVSATVIGAILLLSMKRKREKNRTAEKTSQTT